MSDSLPPRICRVVADVFGLEETEVGIDTSHEDVEDWDSLQIVQLSIALEHEFDVSFRPEESITFFSVKNIHAALSDKGAR